ncbi:helix-turn-helix domain-containing protein [Terriglobus sp. 2YAB30_2]|uniref:helix-turn-helix domain-containing protein n=1 Tax=unclassified Terriglobus TaxID=2628988 RepID=UPI003F9D0FB1
MPSTKVQNKPTHVTRGDIFDDLGLSPQEAAEAKVKADLWRDLIAQIEKQKLTQKNLIQLLGVHQPEVSNLLNGKLSKFAFGTLIRYAVNLNLNVSVRLTAPKTIKRPVSQTWAQEKRQRRASA